MIERMFKSEMRRWIASIIKNEQGVLPDDIDNLVEHRIKILMKPHKSFSKKNKNDVIGADITRINRKKIVGKLKHLRKS